ncbi:MAG: hypothetical protein A3F46_06870 [Legionellales bacterium RIFCSPHIGHO2_12_FULL_42_9]|nr:MAG: hypothetical protein A3F46_06870 [Legionellales bacterium RIFCSPHIGHO2_12_FULL_42_9]
MSSDIIFVGAGPVGLYTAIQAKLYNPSINILMLERDTDYKRTHILNLDTKSYLGSHPDPYFQDLLRQLDGFVPTNEIETKLKRFAEGLGIVFHYEKINNIEALISNYPHASTIIGADGAHSLVRKEIFHDEKQTDIMLQHIIEVKFHSQNATRNLNLSEMAKAQIHIDQLAVEAVGHEKDRKTPVSLVFFVDEYTYKEFHDYGATSWHPIQFKDLLQANTPHMKAMANSIMSWMSHRQQHTGERLVAGSEKIAAVEFSTTFSKSVVTKKNKINFMLVGDAALSVPFFRSVNAGFIGGNFAARLIAENNYTSKDYQYDYNALARKEIDDAWIMNLLVDLGKITIAFIRFFPACGHYIYNHLSQIIENIYLRRNDVDDSSQSAEVQNVAFKPSFREHGFFNSTAEVKTGVVPDRWIPDIKDF